MKYSYVVMFTSAKYYIADCTEKQQINNQGLIMLNGFNLNIQLDALQIDYEDKLNYKSILINEENKFRNSVTNAILSNNATDGEELKIYGSQTLTMHMYLFLTHIKTGILQKIWQPGYIQNFQYTHLLTHTYGGMQTSYSKKLMINLLAQLPHSTICMTFVTKQQAMYI